MLDKKSPTHHSTTSPSNSASARRSQIIWSFAGFIFLTLALGFIMYFSDVVVRLSQDNREQAAGGQVAKLSSEQVKVLVIQYFPEDASKPGYLDGNIIGPGLGNTSIADMRNKLTTLTQEVMSSLEKGSQYHGYTDTSTIPYLNYQQYGQAIEYKEVFPLQSTPTPWNSTAFRPDYTFVLNRENICDLVDNQGVRQVWLWGYHHGKTEPAESNMSMGRVSQSFWTHGSYGDVSNSERVNDMPICEHTYTLFNYNYARGLAEALEDHTHQLEELYKFLQYKDPSETQSGGVLFWNKFVGAQNSSDTSTTPGCGWTHYPPNISLGQRPYLWYSDRKVMSDCMDWKPDGSGQKTEVSCETWGGPGCKDDGGTAFKIWWMRSLPGYNNGLWYMGRNVRNWWEPVADFDRVLAEGGGLLEPNLSAPPTPTPSPESSPIPIHTIRPFPSPSPESSPIPIHTIRPFPSPSPTQRPRPSIYPSPIMSPYPTPVVSAIPWPTPTPQVSPTPTPTPFVFPTTSPKPRPTIYPSPITSPNPTTTPYPRPTNTPAVIIAYPSEYLSISQSIEKQFCIVDIPIANTDGLQRKQSINGSPWTEYAERSMLCYEPSNGANTLQLQYKNAGGFEGPVLTRKFTILWSCPSTPHANYDSANPAINIADYINFLFSWRARTVRGDYDCSESVNLHDYILYLNDWRKK